MVYWEIRTKMRKFVCLLCTYPILSKNIFWHHGSYFGAAYVRAHAARYFFDSPKKKILQKWPKFHQILKKTFFSKFRILFLMHVNHTKIYFETYSTPKLLQKKIYEICYCAEDYILIFSKKKKILKFPIFWQRTFSKSHMWRAEVRATV